MTNYPRQITGVNERIAGIERDIALYNEQSARGTNIQHGVDGSASVTAVFHGMTIKGVEYTEKEPAAKALLEACKTITSKEEVNIGSYMGFHMSLSFDNFNKAVHLLLRGSMTYQTELGTDAFGNITRINNTLDSLPKRLEGAKTQLENLLSQQEAAKEELKKPFALEDELAQKEARLALLNAELNIDGIGGRGASDNMDIEADSPEIYEPPDDGEDGCEAVYDGEYEREPAYAKSARPSFLEDIRSYKHGLARTKVYGAFTEFSEQVGDKDLRRFCALDWDNPAIFRIFVFMNRFL